MKLKSIVLDGFKSYAHRQELDDLDGHFNAITGLNGSGKSNIFDAICFVMGITNLKKVRADDTRDLIYKNGNAGIQRASVTLEFLNDDDSTAPPGYNTEDFPRISVARQVICGGKQKFFLNGRLAQQSHIKAFFHSVSMNVDNPHFLVLQGTVHKLLNMKPIEVLSWIEEAAGTRMFDARKRVAEHMIMNKDKKLQEIDHTLRNEVASMIQSMGEEQIEYDKYLRISESLQQKRHFKIAYSYWRNMNSISEADIFLKECEEQMSELQNEIEKVLPAKLSQAKNLLSESSEKQKNAELGESVAQLSDNIRDKKQYFHKIKTEIVLLEKNQHKIVNIQKSLQKDLDLQEAYFSKNKSEFEKVEEEFTTLTEEKKDIINRIDGLKVSIQMLKSGLHAGESGMTLLDEQKIVQKNILNFNHSIHAQEAEAQSTKAALESLASRNHVLIDLFQNQESDITNMKENLRSAEEEFQKSQMQINGQNSSDVEKRFISLQREKDALAADSQNHVTYFAYDMPEDRPVPHIQEKIFGRLGLFVTVRNPSLHSLALSVAARDNLRKVVVETGEVAQYLIEKCRTKERTTYFVMDSVKKVGKLDASKQQMAHDAAREQHSKNNAMGNTSECWATLAINLISYPEKMELIVEQIFGRFFVCSDLGTARAVALGQAKTRAVTIDGDIVEPGGTFTGGSSGNLRDTLQIFSKCHDCETKMKNIDEQLRELHLARRTNQQRQSSIEQKREVVVSLSDRLQVLKTLHKQSADELENINKDRTRLSEAHIIAEQKAKDFLTQMRIEEKRLNDIKDSLRKGFEPEERRKEFVERVVFLEGRRNEITITLERKQKFYDEYIMQKESFGARRNALVKKLSDVSQELGCIEKDGTEKQLLLDNVKNEICMHENELSLHHSQLRELEKEHEVLKGNYQRLHEKDNSIRKIMQKMEVDVCAKRKTMESAREQNNSLLKSHPFLPANEHRFGGVDSQEYYFLDTEKTKATLDSLEEDERTLESLSKRVNKKVKFMIEESKKEYEDLLVQRNALLKDKEVILKTIGIVEEKKWRSLDLMVGKVSAGFSSLFGASLPGASCRLVEHREDSKLVGLEVKVSFQGKEKDSLTELSGGQRSLLALCLILAILKFRPAPVYILDEIDAALDPSHTQNIGKMLQKHFRNAQFLLVSLKDGMFSNASVVYEIRHTQGFSEIHRRVNSGK